jgi:hypothetical protein
MKRPCAVARGKDINKLNPRGPGCFYTVYNISITTPVVSALKNYDTVWYLYL